MSGKALAENINEAFVSVTKEIPPLNRPHIDILPENSHYDISPEFIINEEEVYHKLSIIYQLLNLLVQMEYQTGF